MSTRKSATNQQNQGFDKSTLQDQYRALKSRYPSSLLLFHIGENYEAYGDDATDLHQVLGLRLMTNSYALESMRTQARFPVSELHGYLTRLVEAGHKVAVCDKLEDPPTFQGPDTAVVSSHPALPVESDHQSENAVSKESVFARIDPRSIHISPFQHRTVFDPVEMEELRKDIAKNGVHTALIVRRHSSIEAEFELATGERRLRIAVELNLPDVPVLIRDMTDRQVQELQWSENFRRVNPDPLDEASGLHQMLSYHKTVDGLARYIGKPKAYVLSRLTLLNLIPALRDMVHARMFNLRDSLDVATLDQDAQNAFYKEYCADWKGKQTFRLRDLSSALAKFRRDLSRAIFDPKDKDLVPAAGACTACKHNSAALHSLFPDMEKKSLCNRQDCFENKCLAHRRRMLTQAIEKYQPTALVSSGPIGKTWQALLDELPATAAIPRYSYQDIYTVWEPTEPDRDDYGDDNDGEGFDEEGYAEALNEYRAKKDEFEQGLREGKLQKGLFLQTDSVTVVLFDTERQRTHDAPIVTATAAAVQQAIKAGTATPEMLQGEMSRIREREKRNSELDLEKIQAAVHDSFAAKLAGEEALPATTAQDQLGIRLLIYQALDYSTKAALHQRYPYPEKKEVEDRCPLTKWLAQLSDEQVAFMTRLAIRCHKEATNPLTDAGDALRQMAEGIGVDVAGIRAAQKKVAATRSSKASDRLSALKQRIDALQPKEVNADPAQAAA